MPFDSVVSIGGQSLLDGAWRILQPALQSLTNPLPVTVPGMTNAWVRIRNIAPSLSSSGPASLAVLVDVEARGDILLTASVRAGTVHLALPNANIRIPPLVTDAAPVAFLHLPTGDIPITLPNMGETLPAPIGTITLHPVPDPTTGRSTGGMHLPDGGTVTFPPLSGILEFVEGSLGNVGLPLPSVVPLAVNLTPTNPAQVPVALVLSVHSPINEGSAFGLLLELGLPMIGPVGSFPDTTVFETAIRSGLRGLLTQLGVTLPAPALGAEPFAGVGPTLAEIRSAASNIAAAAQTAIQDVVKDALTGLTARTGRLILSEAIPSPLPVPPQPCEVALLPTDAMAQFDPRASNPVLQVGFFRSRFSAEPFPFPNFVPNRAADVEVKIGNDFLRDLLCCMVEKLPNFTFHGPAAPSVIGDRNCCSWSGVSLDLWPVVLSGTLSLCIVGPSGDSKSVELTGDFLQDNSLGRIGVKFTLKMEFHLNEVAAVTGLRLATVTVVDPFCAINGLVWALLIGAGTISLLVPGMLVLLIGLPLLIIAFVHAQLRAVVDTLLSRAHGLTSPMAVPLAIFEAFGRFVPVSTKIDDLTAIGVLATPTSPWALTPISAKHRRYPDPELGTYLTASVNKESQGPQ